MIAAAVESSTSFTVVDEPYLTNEALARAAFLRLAAERSNQAVVLASLLFEAGDGYSKVSTELVGDYLEVARRAEHAEARWHASLTWPFPTGGSGVRFYCSVCPTSILPGPDVDAFWADVYEHEANHLEQS